MNSNELAKLQLNARLDAMSQKYLSPESISGKFVSFLFFGVLILEAFVITFMLLQLGIDPTGTLVMSILTFVQLFHSKRQIAIDENIHIGYIEFSYGIYSLVYILIGIGFDMIF